MKLYNKGQRKIQYKDGDDIKVLLPSSTADVDDKTAANLVKLFVGEVVDAETIVSGGVDYKAKYLAEVKSHSETKAKMDKLLNTDNTQKENSGRSKRKKNK